MSTRAVEADYLVIGAGAAGMAFTDALLDARDDVRVVMVDRRHAAGGHWLEAYPFVRLHQASSFYGVASRVLGGGRVQASGPEAGLSERADQPTVCAYFAEVLADRVGTGRLSFFGGCEYRGGRTFLSRVSGQRYAVPEDCRVVDARYLAPVIPAETPPRFAVADGARVVPVNELAHLAEAPSQFVVLGSGKTATDAVVWLLGHGVDPGAISWVRPREPWMLNRAVIQPDPAAWFGMVAGLVDAAASAASLDDFFLRLEDDGTMLRIDRSVTPTMAKAPTLGTWELDLLRTVEDVVRLGRVTGVRRGRLDLQEGSVPIAEDALVVNCAGDGLRRPPRVPVWQPEAITVQTVRAGFPCFGAALIGHVEGTRDDDATKNALCPPSSYGDTLRDWAEMQLLGMRASASFGAEPDIKAWADSVAINPGRVPADPSPAVADALARVAGGTPAGMAGLARLSAD